MDWNAFYRDAVSPDFERMMAHPDEWQVTLAEYICRLVGNGVLLEAGCGYGLTSLLVGKNVRRTLMDVESKAIEMARLLFATAGQCAKFEFGDIFDMSFPNDTFDVVFNAGVMEHFAFDGRRAALLEMVRVTKPGGKICVAVPNHYSIPYRFSYEYSKSHGTWSYPDEEKLYDFTEELAESANVVHLSRQTIAEKTCFYYLTKPQKLWFKMLHKLLRYEGYLAVITMEKSHAENLESTQNMERGSR